MPDPMIQLLDAAEIDERYQPTRTRAVICLDSELVMRIARLEDQIKDAQQGDSAADPIGPLAEEVLALRGQAKAAQVEFVFRSIGRLAYRELIRDHPPTDEQKKLAGPDFHLSWNTDTFPAALMAASCESVRNGTVAWWSRKLNEWGDGQVARLWQACIAAQDGVNDVPKAGHAFAAMRTRGESSE